MSESEASKMSQENALTRVVHQMVSLPECFGWSVCEYFAPSSVARPASVMTDLALVHVPDIRSDDHSDDHVTIGYRLNHCMSRICGPLATQHS